MAGPQRLSKALPTTCESYANNPTIGGPRYFPPSFAETIPEQPSLTPSPDDRVTPTTHNTRQLPFPLTSISHPSTPTEESPLSSPIDAMEDDKTFGVAYSIHAPRPMTTPPTIMPASPTATPAPSAEVPKLLPPTPSQMPRTPPNTMVQHLAMEVAPPNPDEARIRALLAISATTHDALGQRSSLPTNPYGNQFTNPPDDGFPRIELLTTTELIENLDSDLLNNWFSAPQPKLLIRPFEWRGPDPPTTVQPLAEKIRTSISEIAIAMNLTNSVINISPPIASSQKPTRLPNAFLVYGIPNQVAQALLEQRVWSSTTVTFEARIFGDTQPPTLFMALSGFTTFDDAVVKQAIQHTWTSAEVYHHIANTIMEIDNTYSSEASHPALQSAVNRFIDTIIVERVDTKIAGGILAPRYHMYSHNLPSAHPAAWEKVRLHLANLTYPTAMEGTGTKERLLPCLICHSHAHPMGLCPFPAIPGWHGPIFRQRGQFTPVRGRGRGSGAARPPDYHDQY